MRMCQLISSYEKSASPFKALDTYPDASRWLPRFEWTTHLVEKASAGATVDKLVAQGFDVFVNLCDGEPDEDIAGAEVSERLEWQGVAFTGADARCARFGSSRQSLKELCRAVGVDTPAYAFLRSDEDLDAASAALRFPLIVKPPNGYASIGIERSSRVETAEALGRELVRLREQFSGALVEEFIEGPEFTVLAAEPPPGQTTPIVYRPMQVRFPAGEHFKHFGLKWIGYEQMSLSPVVDATLDRRLREHVQRIFAGLDGVGYCRCDIRMNAEGRLFMLDYNTTPGVFYPPGSFCCCDFILAQEEDGHSRFLEHLISCAQHRAAHRARPAR